MVLGNVNKTALKRLRVALKHEQQRTGQVLPKRALKFFGRLKNIDERKLREAESFGQHKVVAKVGRDNFYPGYAVRVIRMKGEKEGVVLKLPTLANKQYKVSAREEIKFVRRMVEAVNAQLSGKGFVIEKPIGHSVGPFIAMKKTNFPTIHDLYYSNDILKAKQMLSKLSKEMGISEDEVKKKISDIGALISLESYKIISDGKVVLSKNYPARGWIEHENGYSYSLKPLDSQHLQIVGQKNGVIQLVPYIDAI